MRIIQVLTTLSYGDAVGNDALALWDTLRNAGYKTEMYAENVGKNVPKHISRHINNLKNLRKDDIILYHLSTGTNLNFKLPDYPGRKILIYHNITPASFFSGYSCIDEQLCSSGREAAKYLSDKTDYCIADSEFNEQELREMGYRCPIDVVPVLIPFDDYKREPDRKIIEAYSGDGYVNILFTGRIAPNKCQEDIIASFYKYHTYYNKKSRLILAGNTSSSNYYEKLKHYTNKLGIDESVVFTGHIAFSEILAYYHIADVFLCMSEHEGFCVPLVEAMYFDIPIIAFDSTAIPYTLGGCGILLKNKNPLETAGVINYILKNSEVKETILHEQRERLNDFKHDVIEERFLSLIKEFSEGSK